MLLTLSRTSEAIQFAYQIRDAFRKFTLPDHPRAPSQVFEQLEVPGIPLNISIDLPGPVFTIGGRQARPLATMPMPLAAVDKYRQFVLRKDKVGRAGKVLSMDSVAVPGIVNRSPHGEFRFCVPGRHFGHDLAAVRSGNIVGHGPVSGLIISLREPPNSWHDAQLLREIVKMNLNPRRLPVFG